MATINPRVNITVAPELKSWFEGQAKDMGISLSGLIVVAMMQYKQNTEALKQMQGIPALMEEIKKMQDRQLVLESQK